MELTSLYYFKTAAEHESLTKAAEQLHISQPGLSKSIAKLESNLGVDLFIRDKSGLKLSGIGREFYGYVAKAFEQIAAGEYRVKTYLENESKTVSIASPISDLLKTMVVDFFDRYSGMGVSVNQFIYTPEVLESKLMYNELDFVFTPILIADSSLETRELMTEEVYLAVSLKNALAGRRSVDIASLSGEKFLVDESVFDRKIVAHHCGQAGFSPRVALCSSESQIVLESLDENYGVCFLPASMIARTGRDEIERRFSLLRISDIPVLRKIYMIKRRDRRLSESASLLYNHSVGFFKMLQEKIKDYPQGGFADLPTPWGGQIPSENTFQCSDFSIIN